MSVLVSRSTYSVTNAMAYIFGVTPLRPEVGGMVKLEVLGFTDSVL
jgi:hypothetical protein